ncbi:hypothetical protein CURTO8I2_70024 [Curtobacterium sp. 8I-2]|nr:hypothetical protein CURTO8I2_70024 [Curtobacterium sp. 8I-2]
MDEHDGGVGLVAERPARRHGVQAHGQPVDPDGLHSSAHEPRLRGGSQHRVSLVIGCPQPGRVECWHERHHSHPRPRTGRLRPGEPGDDADRLGRHPDVDRHARRARARATTAAAAAAAAAAAVPRRHRSLEPRRPERHHPLVRSRNHGRPPEHRPEAPVVLAGARRRRRTRSAARRWRRRVRRRPRDRRRSVTVHDPGAGHGPVPGQRHRELTGGYDPDHAEDHCRSVHVGRRRRAGPLRVPVRQLRRRARCRDGCLHGPHRHRAARPEQLPRVVRVVASPPGGPLRAVDQPDREARGLHHARRRPDLAEQHPDPGRRPRVRPRPAAARRSRHRRVRQCHARPQPAVRRGPRRTAAHDPPGDRRPWPAALRADRPAHAPASGRQHRDEQGERAEHLRAVRRLTDPPRASRPLPVMRPAEPRVPSWVTTRTRGTPEQA